MALGLTIQPMECQGDPILCHGVPCGKLSVVGTAIGVDIRQSTRNALERLGVLRFFIHDCYSWKPPGVGSLLLYSLAGA